jgi:hypothetical protein
MRLGQSLQEFDNCSVIWVSRAAKRHSLRFNVALRVTMSAGIIPGCHGGKIMMEYQIRDHVISSFVIECVFNF